MADWDDAANLLQGLVGSLIGAAATVIGIWLAFGLEGRRRTWDAHADQLARLEAAAYDAEGVLNNLFDRDVVAIGGGKTRDAARRDYLQAVRQVQREALALMGVTHRLPGGKGSVAKAQAVLLVNATAQALGVLAEPVGPGTFQYLVDWSQKGGARLAPCLSARVLWDGYAAGTVREARRRFRDDHGDANLPLTRLERWRLTGRSAD